MGSIVDIARSNPDLDFVFFDPESAAQAGLELQAAGFDVDLFPWQDGIGYVVRYRPAVLGLN